MNIVMVERAKETAQLERTHKDGYAEVYSLLNRGGVRVDCLCPDGFIYHSLVMDTATALDLVACLIKSLRR